MFKQFDITVDTLKDVKNTSFKVNTNDLNTLKLLINIVNGGVPLDLTGTTVRLTVKKPDNTTVFQDCTITDAINGKVEIVLSSQAYVIQGKYEAEVYIYSGVDAVAVTSYFNYEAKKGVLDAGSVQSSNDWPALSQALLLSDEVVTARGTFPNLDGRLDDVTTQLASIPNQTYITEKAKTTDVNTALSLKSDKTEVRFAYIKIEPNDLSDSVKAMMAGTSPVLSYVEDFTITPDKNSYIREYLYNMFNKNTAIIDSYIDGAGNVGTMSGYYASDYIKVIPNKSYAMNTTYNYAVYDSNHTLLAFNATGWTGIQVMPSTAKYIRVSVIASNIDTAMVCEDSLPPTYVPYGQSKIIITDTRFKNLLDNNTTDYFNVNQISPNQTTFFSENRINLFDKTKVVNGVIGTDGSNDGNVNYRATDYIPVLEGRTYITNSPYRVALYDTNKVFTVLVTTNGSTPFTIPTGSVYMRTTFDYFYNTTAIDTGMICENALPVSYVSYDKTQVSFKSISIENDITSAIINNNNFPGNGGFLNGKNWCVVGDSISDNINYSNIQHYYELIKAKVNCNIFMQGKAGTGFLQTYPALGYENIINRIALLDNTSDYITVFAGTNDINQTLGTLGDTGTTTLYGAIDYVCTSLINKFPTKKIAFFTPLPRSGYQGINNNLEKVAKAIKEVCAIYSIPVLDLYTESGLRPWNTTNNQTYFDNADGLHPNTLGHEWIYPRILKFMEKL